MTTEPQYNLTNAAIGTPLVIERYDRSIEMTRYSFGKVVKFTTHKPKRLVVEIEGMGARSYEYDASDGYSIGRGMKAGVGRARLFLANETRHDLELANVAADDKLAEIKEANERKSNDRRNAALLANATALPSMTWIQGAPGSIGIVNMIKENGERLTMFVTVETRKDFDWNVTDKQKAEFTSFVLSVIGYGSDWYKHGFSTSNSDPARSIDEAIVNLIVKEW
jgi:hypothetical protein